jgi:hypothetical protein
MHCPWWVALVQCPCPFLSLTEDAGPDGAARVGAQSVDCTRLLHSEEQTCPRTSQAVVARTVVPHRVVVDPPAEVAVGRRVRVVTVAPAPAVTVRRAQARAVVAREDDPSGAVPDAVSDVRVALVDPVAAVAAVTAGPPVPGSLPGSQSSPSLALLRA